MIIIYLNGDFMRRLSAFGLCLLLCVNAVPIQAETSSEAYCVMAEDGRVLMGENLHQTQSVASISKIMTAVVALEHGLLEEELEAGEEIKLAVGSSIYLKQGEKMSLQDLLYGLMLRSGNDAAMVIACELAGDVETFVGWMNDQADELGMADSLFRNPSGLDEEDGGNLSSPYDMALLMRHAMTLPLFRAIVSCETYRNAKGQVWVNKNRLLEDYAYTTGGKTGYTKQAGRTLVSSAEKEGLEVFAVTFRMGDDFAFHAQCYDEVFANYDDVLILRPGSYVIDGKRYLVDEELRLCLKQGETYQAEEFLEDGQYCIETVVNNEVRRYAYAQEGA